MAYFLPGSKALWGTEARGEEQDGSALRPPLRQCDPGGGRPGAGVTRVGVIPGLVARHPPQRPGCGLRAGLSSSLACPVLGRTQARGGCSVAGSWCSDSRGQLRATEGKGLTGRPPPHPRPGEGCPRGWPWGGTSEGPQCPRGERVSLPLNVCAQRGSCQLSIPSSGVLEPSPGSGAHGSTCLPAQSKPWMLSVCVAPQAGGRDGVCWGCGGSLSCVERGCGSSHAV